MALGSLVRTWSRVRGNTSLCVPKVRMTSTANANAADAAGGWRPPAPSEPAPQLYVWNSLTRSKVPFVPMRARHVTWYNCGPTVYDASHMGHARNYVTQDILRRIMRDYLGYDVQLSLIHI